MADYIDRDAALDFDFNVEVDSVEELQTVMRGVALYADYLKSLPVYQLPEDTDSSKATERVLL